MDVHAVQKEIRTFVVDNFLLCDEEAGFKDDASFLESGFIDSTGILELITFLEEHYEIAIADEETLPENLDSVIRVARFVTGKCQRFSQSPGAQPF